MLKELEKIISGDNINEFSLRTRKDSRHWYAIVDIGTRAKIKVYDIDTKESKQSDGYELRVTGKTAEDAIKKILLVIEQDKKIQWNKNK